MSKSLIPKASCSYNASDSDPYMTDEDSAYEPPSVPHLNVNQSQHVSELLENNSSDSPHVTPKRTRKRRLNIKGHKKQIRKNATLQGLEYETAKGKKVMKKKLKAYEHRCGYKCHEINEADRQMLFTRFYQLKSIEIKYAKWENLQRLLPYVPPIHHKFCNELPHKEKNIIKQSRANSRGQTHESNDDTARNEPDMIILDLDYED
ncbi:unnamed protein product [Diabrotica balteata]|uniref:Uncharacterized protein n=1 Tax=Diabrotica balteata TaxID=107213 RepID=A0A9N9X3T6_DIABA|nr:unnamed protein product [Diabrotica balteata]